MSRKQVMRLSTPEKLAWLHAHGLLPMPTHQSSGTFLAKVKREGHGYNPMTKKEVKCWRSVTEVVAGSLLRPVASGRALLPLPQPPPTGPSGPDPFWAAACAGGYPGSEPMCT